ncbi:MAG: hypothetical protein JSS75_12745 [Bacteroidetes bacterium]|nr:hypothetical protein [Bacteroidota bacterium]
MTKNLKLLAIVFILAGFIGGCTQRIGDFTVISTKNCNVETGGKFVKKGSFEGDDIAWIIIFIPTGSPNLKTAVDRCIEAGDGDLITNVVLSATNWYFLVGQVGYTVKGDVWRAASRSDIDNPNVEKFTLVNTNDGKQLVSDKDPSVHCMVADASNPKSIRYE